MMVQPTAEGNARARLTCPLLAAKATDSRRDANGDLSCTFDPKGRKGRSHATVARNAELTHHLPAER